MIATILRVEAIVAGYGKMPILDQVTMVLAHGEIVSIIGPNGAGKSTVFKTSVGFLRPSEGRVIFDGREINGLRPDQVFRRGLAYVPQGRIVFPQRRTPWAAIVGMSTSPLGVPRSPPPWGTILALHLATGAVRWEQPFGTARAVTLAIWRAVSGSPSWVSSPAVTSCMSAAAAGPVRSGVLGTSSITKPSADRR